MGLGQAAFSAVYRLAGCADCLANVRESERASVWFNAACLTKWTGVTTSYTKGGLTLSQQKPSTYSRAQGGVDLVITA